MLAFLCGGMEFASDDGRGWRELIDAWLQRNINHYVYDPTHEARRILSAEELNGLRTWKLTDLDRFRRLVRFIINHDLDVMARRADYVICYWDEAAARGGGTQAELTSAFRKGIPVYLVTEIPIERVSGWVVGCTDRVFSSFDDLKAYLAATYGKEARQTALWEKR